MRTGILVGLSGLGLLATSPVSVAQTGTTQSIAIEEVIVSARRQDETLQNVPQTLNVVNADTIDDLKILKFEDVEAAVPGLSLSTGGNGYTTSASMRGVTFDPGSRTSATVEFYMNEALVGSNFLFQSLFDIGQIEVLRGPQGTLRGRAAPSGAITVSTREADVSSIGGYVGATTTNLDGDNLQGAINVPLITDKLALRIAGVVDRSEFDGVRSVNSSTDPESKTDALRMSLRFEPTDTVDASLMYQRMEKELTSFVPVAGQGAPAHAYHAAGYNGPVLRASDRRGITDGPNRADQTFDVVVAQVNWELGSQLLSYVGSYNEWDSEVRDPLDDGNLLTNAEIYQEQAFLSRSVSHELRLSSLEPLFDRFDYTVGGYFSETTLNAASPLPFAYLPGVFGSPLGQPDPAAFDARYVLFGLPRLPTNDKETSVFANLTWHLSDSTALSVGGRYIMFKARSGLVGDTAPALMAIPGGPCPGGSTYAGTCDIEVPAMQGIIAMQAPDIDEDPFVYNVTLSHHFNNDFMGYATVGTSWRRGVDASAGINNAGNNAELTDLTLVDPEKSRSIELGFKWAFLDNRGRLNGAVYHQEFEGLIFQPPAVPYLSDNGVGAPAVDIQQFSANADAVIDGVDLDAAFMLTPNWSIAAAFSYADGNVDNDDVPCRDSNFDGVADNGAVTPESFPAGTVVAFCKSDMPVSTAPKWNANLQSEYSMPLAAGFDFYLRGLYTYYPANKNRSAGFTVDNYGLLNLYAGLRDGDGAWDLSLFARNVLNEGTTLSMDPDQVQSGGDIDTAFGPSGYYTTSYTPRREVGLNVRYTFGSR